MTRKIKRTHDFDLTLDVKDDHFIRPPNASQRNWLLNRFMREASDDLQALHDIADTFVPGEARRLPADMRTAELSDDLIMEAWQLPLMRDMALVAARSGGDVLEVGFGRGISASLIQEHGVQSHTVIECNDSVVRRYAQWRASYANRDIRLAHGLWQDVIGDLGMFDAIFYHTYALDEDESVERLTSSVTYADNFFPIAAAHLVQGGVFTYLTNEIDSLSRSHQRLLFKHFTSYRLHQVKLDLPHNVRDAWWANSMTVIEVVK